MHNEANIVALCIATCLPIMKYAIGQYRSICNGIILIIALGKSIAVMLHTIGILTMRRHAYIR